jgi:hypothetical protein
MRKALLLIITIFMLGGCHKKNQQSQPAANNPVPSTPVSITLYPNDPLNFKIQAIGGWMYYSGGINGIIIYRKSEQEFIALERTSSYLPDNANAKVKVQNDNFTCKDSISGSKWQIIDGTVIAGPATWGLRLYGTTFDGNVLKIRN